MSREIKFRYVTQYTFEGNVSIFMHVLYFQHIEDTFDVIDLIYGDTNHVGGSFEILSRDEFTGLKDKNGVEIYEGDIVMWGHVDGYIEMSGSRVAVVDMSVPSDGLTFNAFKPMPHRFKIGNFMYRESTEKCMEIIGNIHQNPELLEQ